VEDDKPWEEIQELIKDSHEIATARDVDQCSILHKAVHYNRAREFHRIDDCYHLYLVRFDLHTVYTLR